MYPWEEAELPSIKNHVFQISLDLTMVVSKHAVFPTAKIAGSGAGTRTPSCAGDNGKGATPLLKGRPIPS
jgi:hypothetical protein